MDFSVCLSSLAFRGNSDLPLGEWWIQSISVNQWPAASAALGKPTMLGEAASLLYTGLGCARPPKKLLIDIPTIPHRQLEKDTALCDSNEVCDIAVPYVEATLSAAPSRRGSFEYQGSGFFAQPANSPETENAEAGVVSWKAPACHACNAPITGALYMAFDRAYCGAAACHKAMARHCLTSGESCGSSECCTHQYTLTCAGEKHQTLAVDAMFADQKKSARSKRRR